ncbi:hypothetical protein KCU73_g4426, partial [Aureobasidium melanogenum]
MSSDSSVTVRDESGEPPAKRQKTFDHGPDAVVLRVDISGHGFGSEDQMETIAVVNATRFHRATKGRFKSSEASMTHNGTKVMDANMSVIIFTGEPESVIRVLAQWIHADDVDKAFLEACDQDDAEDDHWVYLLVQVIEFWLRNRLDDSVHDRLIDCLIDWLKAEKDEGSSLVTAINIAENAVKELPSDQISMLMTGSRIIEILACLNLYHTRVYRGPCGLYEREDENALGPHINDEAYAYLLAGWGDASKYPQDPLKDDFDQHCRYHLHGDKKLVALEEVSGIVQTNDRQQFDQV